eukprot:TRINITY_DN15546_c0_g1_i1.p1 TRINITY_DN15546_c0_g1~~TRINITY_DN15546_c0_g1_i1.p1  ORF type:complete len:136 (-),score=25.73 TRINITY_DN15546_c0_g1_i1:23-430(-)
MTGFPDVLATVDMAKTSIFSVSETILENPVHTGGIFAIALFLSAMYFFMRNATDLRCKNGHPLNFFYRVPPGEEMPDHWCDVCNKDIASYQPFYACDGVLPNGKQCDFDACLQCTNDSINADEARLGRKEGKLKC